MFSRRLTAVPTEVHFHHYLVHFVVLKALTILQVDCLNHTLDTRDLCICMKSTFNVTLDLVHVVHLLDHLLSSLMDILGIVLQFCHYLLHKLWFH